MFMYLLALFIVKNFLKILRANPEFWGCIIFETKLVQTGLFLETVITYWSTYRLPSLCNIWKKFLKLISRKLKIYKFRPPPFIPAFTEAVHRALYGGKNAHTCKLLQYVYLCWSQWQMFRSFPGGCSFIFTIPDPFRLWYFFSLFPFRFPRVIFCLFVTVFFLHIYRKTLNSTIYALFPCFEINFTSIKKHLQLFMIKVFRLFMKQVERSFASIYMQLLCCAFSNHFTKYRYFNLIGLPDTEDILLCTARHFLEQHCKNCWHVLFWLIPAIIHFDIFKTRPIKQTWKTRYARIIIQNVFFSLYINTLLRWRFLSTKAKMRLYNSNWGTFLHWTKWKSSCLIRLIYRDMTVKRHFRPYFPIELW